MLTDADFLRTIRAAPDDDAPRLVYADWLEDRGASARAEFIRVQIELARMGRSDHRRRAELRIVEEALLDRVLLESRPAPGDGVRDLRFERGVVVGVSLTAAVFLRRVDELCDSTAVTDFTISRIGPHIRRLCECPRLSELRSLAVRSPDTPPADLIELIRTPTLSGLRRLDVGNNSLPSSAFRDILGSLNLQSVETFEYWRNECYAVLDLANELQSLRRLDLELTNLTESAIAGMSAARVLEPLRSLRLSRNPFGRIGLQAMFGQTTLDNLTTLELSQCQIDDDGVRSLVDSYAALGLEELDLSHNDIGPVGARALAQSSRLSAIRKLDLRGNHFSKAEARLLYRRFGTRLTM